VATEPDGVTIGTEVSVAGTVMVVVPPFEVKTDETTYDEATETVSVDPFEVSTTTDETGEIDEAEMNDETATGTETVDPETVVTDSVAYGVDEAGVSTVYEAPDGV